MRHLCALRAGEIPGPMSLCSVMLKGRLLGWVPQISASTPMAQHTESTNFTPSSLTVEKKFKMFKITGSAPQGSKQHFRNHIVIYIYSTIGDFGDSKTNKS